MILLDSDHFTVVTNKDYSGHIALVDRLRNQPQDVRLPVIVAEESLKGWLAQVHRAKRESQKIAAYHHLIKVISALSKSQIVPWTEEAARELARQRGLRVNIPPHDLMIASLAITHDALLLTRNAKDFSRVHGLRFESWLD